MTSRRPNPRPSSAIYIGTETIPPLPSPPSPAHSVSSTRSTSSNRSQLPSPPATNSTGSIGDNNSTGTGSVGRLGMVTGEKQLLPRHEENDDNGNENDEDDTAKFSIDRRAVKGKQPESSYSSIQRARSLTERNRKVLDRFTPITTSDPPYRSTASSAISSRSRNSPLPSFPSASSSSAVSSNSRVSFYGGSGSETERERRNTDRTRPRTSVDTSSDDNDATTPPASVGPEFTFDRANPRQRLRSAPSTPSKGTIPLSPRKNSSTTNVSTAGSGRRARRVSIQHPGDDVEEENESTTNRTIGGSGSRKARAPLPREFRDRRSFDGKSVGESSNASSQTGDLATSSGVLTGRGSALMNSSGAGGTFTMSPVSPRSQRPARPSTVRDFSRRAQKWSGVDDIAKTGEEEGRKQWRHGSSMESPLGGKEGRSVVSEGLRAAGLARRGSEDVFAEIASHRRARSSANGINTSGELDDPGQGSSPLIERSTDPRDPRTPLTASALSTRFGVTRNTANIHTVLSRSASRAGTSMGSYGGDEESSRAPSQPLRTHRSPLLSGTRLTPQSRNSPGTGTFGRGTPQPFSATPSSEHARLMLDSLSMFEGQLARVTNGAPDLMRTAQGVVQSANNLNTLLRAANSRALEAQIEAEIGDAAPMVDASEVWRKIGGEYRESVRASDELVRTLTALLLGVGRLVRESVKERSSGSPDVVERIGGVGGGNGRSSFDRSLVQRHSLDDAGRSDVSSAYRDRESRRSWEESPVNLNSRPSTSLSVARGIVRPGKSNGPNDGDETARERERPSALDRLSLRRMFSSRSRDSNQSPQGSPDPSYPSPSPVSRLMDRATHSNLPPLSVPPPLPSLPSESLLSRSNSSQGRRSKISNTSNATVRGSAIFPSMTSPRNPTTALTPHTVSADEATAFPLIHANTSSSALNGLQQQDFDSRKRSVSGASAQEVSEPSETRTQRGARVRMSLDGADSLQDHIPRTPAPSNSRRERRRTINEIFS